MTIRLSAVAIAALALLVGCGNAQPEAKTPRSDFELRSIAFYAENADELKVMVAVCDEWAASQKAMADWPSVVTANCRNAAQAKEIVAGRTRNSQLKAELAAAREERKRERERREAERLGISASDAGKAPSSDDEAQPQASATPN